MLLAAAFGTRFGRDPTLVDSPLIGQPAPPIDLIRLDGEASWSLADQAGDIVVVNFWASWCVPCREEHDDLVAAAAQYERAGVSFVGIVYQDDPSQAVAFLDELGHGYPHLVDPGSRTAIDYGVFGIPETYFIDRDGTVVAKVTGASDLELLTRTLDTILAGDVPESATRPGYQNQR
ncbi:TlpA family protein disulfide reductase [Euzebya sp.]|uniref:TlpA family protein disulfide reductase n=1 Tax=Euzebya sp. TaxID=1971409 RepID=UPI003514D76E